MLVPIVVLVVIGLGVALTPGLARGTEHAAARFVDAEAYAEHVIEGAGGAPDAEPEPGSGLSVDALVASLATSVVSIGTAWVLLERRRLPRALAAGVGAVRAALAPLRSLHSGHIGDYIAWLTVGVAVFGGILAAVTR
jgi:multicomponent Na+:H+ antiporter subunit D